MTISSVISATNSIFYLPKDLHPFVTCLRDLRKLNQSCSGKSLDPDYENIIDKFVSSYKQLNKSFGVSYINKFHIIESHLKYYFDSTKKPLGAYTDQLVESMHQHTEKIFSRSNYHVKDIESDIHGEKLEAGVHHLNSYNLSK